MSRSHQNETIHYLWQKQQEIGSVSKDGKLDEVQILGPNHCAIAFELNDELYIPILDIFGNVRALLDSSGNCQATYRYSAFGQEEIQGSILPPWRYAGKRFDSETGFIYFGERYYDPNTLCWLTPDPLGDLDGPNLYQFVHNNPLYYTDPNGCFAIAVPLVFELFTITWGAAEGIIATYLTVEAVAATALTVAASAVVYEGAKYVNSPLNSEENGDNSSNTGITDWKRLLIQACEKEVIENSQILKLEKKLDLIKETQANLDMAQRIIIIVIILMPEVTVTCI